MRPAQAEYESRWYFVFRVFRHMIFSSAQSIFKYYLTSVKKGTGSLPELKRHVACRRASGRNAQGYQLVELMITVGIFTALSTGLLGVLATMFQANNSSHNQAMAALIVQEVIDNCRSQSWNTLQANLGTQTLLTNRTASGQTAPESFPRPLLLDTVAKTYSAEARNRLFRASSVTQTLTDIGGGQIRVTVDVAYPSENSNVTKHMVAGTVITEHGIHN